MLKTFCITYATFKTENRAINVDVIAALSDLPRDTYSRIFSSRDLVEVRLVHPRNLDGYPGDSRRAVPVRIDESKAFFSIMDPDAMVVWETGDTCDGIWFILSGSIRHRKHELVSGDWIFIPKGKRCSVRVGDQGATACFCLCLPNGNQKNNT